MSHCVRDVNLGDEKQLLNLFSALDEETEFMLFEPGERILSEKAQTEFIEKVNASNNILLLVSESKGIISGFLGATGEQNKRSRHLVKFVMGVKKKHWGEGAGKKLLTRFEKWALSQGYKKIELTVVKSNVLARGLYESHGFEIEGLRRKSLRIDGEYIDELFMGKLVRHNKID